MREPCEFQDAADDGARVGLFALMTGISEENYCAGWMSGLEFDLWRVEPGTHYGMNAITERQAMLLRLLSEEAGGWWVWRPDGPEFLRTDDWLALLQNRPTD